LIERSRNIRQAHGDAVCSVSVGQVRHSASASFEIVLGRFRLQMSQTAHLASSPMRRRW
jgi:hypothetical protein